MISRLLLLTMSIVVFTTAHLDAAVLTVGQNGTYPLLQDAIDTAIATAAGHNEIRVQSGTYQEALSIVAPEFEGTLLVLGGWNDNFTARLLDPQSTVVDGSHSVRPLTLEISSGEIHFQSITFSNGRVEDVGSFGGGIHASLFGDAVFRMNTCRISQNKAVSSGQAWGGGVWAWTRGGSELHMNNVSVVDNVSDCLFGGGSGGLYIVASDSSTVTISGSRIERNSVRTDNGIAVIQYGGIAMFGDDDSVVVIEDSLVKENTLLGSSSVWASGAQLDGGQSLTVRRCQFIDNSADSSDNVYQTVIRSGLFTDSIVAGGNANGLYIHGNEISVQATNLTIADVPGTGLNVYVGTDSHIAIFNSIAFGNMVDLETSVSSTGILDMGFNLIGIDPGFVEPASRDYHLLIGSPAENAGTNSPPGALGPLDCDRGPRIIDSTVDIGAYEGISEVFTDGFESSTTQAWSSVFPDDVETLSGYALGTRFISKLDSNQSLTRSFQADRDPRERGSRPLNSRR